MGQELSDTELNYAQQSLTGKYPNFKGFQSTLVMSEVEKCENNIQIVVILCIVNSVLYVCYIREWGCALERYIVTRDPVIVLCCSGWLLSYFNH